LATIQLSKDDLSVALQASAAGNRGGTGVYTKRLIEGFREAGIKGVRTIGPSTASPFRKLLSQHAASLPGEDEGFDLIHLPAFGGRVSGSLPYAVTVHDMAFMANPKWFTRIRSLYYRLHFPKVARGAAMIIADSDFTTAEISRYLGLESTRVYLSAPVNRSSEHVFRNRFSIDGEYILSAGTLEPRKNISGLLEAWTAVRALRPHLTLVVAGRWGWGDKSLMNSLRTTPGVCWTGPLATSMLESAFSGARLLVYPSLYEGFGLPPLEAAASGVPFVVGPAAALKEIYGGVAAGICDADPGSISCAILNALESRVDCDMLRDFAAGFTSAEMARNTWNCYLEAVR
jgi:glycosyltransferase involved in cell wall biosynthesis